jgi:hypothetical protein
MQSTNTGRQVPLFVRILNNAAVLPSNTQLLTRPPAPGYTMRASTGWFPMNAHMLMFPQPSIVTIPDEIPRKWLQSKTCFA